MSTTRPNIIYVVCHDLGRQLGCYGRPIDSPNLDRFAGSGVRFANAFCSSPACSPSRGCAMSGQYAHTNGLMGLVNQGWSLPLETRTIVDYLNDGGYETAHFGLQHERSHIENNRYQIEGGGSICTEVAVANAIRYLEERDSDQPFYLNVGTIEVHASQWMKHPHSERWKSYTFDPPEKAYLPPYVPDFPQLREEYGRFQGAIRKFDTEIQPLFDAVKQLGLEEDTLVVVTTDHGIAGHRAKTSIYDAGMEITLLMRMPGTLRQGAVPTEIIQNIDVTPTLLEAAGVDIPDAVQGKSFWGLLTGDDYTPHEYIVTERNYHGGYDPMRAVRTPRYHYIHNFAEDPKRHWLPNEVTAIKPDYEDWFDSLYPERTEPRAVEELYDVQIDPQEFTNLADAPEHAETLKKLRGILDQWMLDTKDPILDGPIPDCLNGWPEDDTAS